MSVKSIAKKAFKSKAITEEEYKQLLCVINYYYKILRRPHGEWIFEDEGKGIMAICSECKAATLSTHGNFCPNCGAEMRV